MSDKQQEYRAYARSIRNLALMFGFLAGVAGLFAIPVSGLFWLVLPDLLKTYTDRFPAIPVWLCFGLVGGVGGYFWYRRAFPENARGAWTLLTVLTGFGVLIGIGFALVGLWGGLAALLFCLLGVGAYIYVEKTTPPAA